MKILYVTNVGSTMCFFTELIRELIRQGHTVDLACNPFQLPEEFAKGQTLIANYPDRVDVLRPYESYICYYEE